MREAFDAERIEPAGTLAGFKGCPLESNYTSGRAGGRENAL
jgi:hypothetical protein